ncbi:MAG: hypothetical protein PHN31_06295 [Candidatus Gracilibacteria bacterium]|nr:hypothetical protein [Candidatus Gracilibacteria bacterium]
MSNLFKKVTSASMALLIVFSIVRPFAGVMAAYSTLEAANKLASLGVIVDNSANPANYRLGDSITRAEMAKITMKLSDETVSDVCEGKFSDLTSDSWACKYAEAGLAKGYFAANATFRPMDVVTKIEALKMVMKARGIEKSSNTDWKAAYVEAAVEAGVIDASFTDYDTVATRGWIFQSSVNAIEGVSDEGDDLLGDLLGDLTGDDTTDTSTGTTDNGTVSTSSTLTVELNPDTLADGTQVPMAGVVRFAKVDFTAGTEDTSINTVTLAKKTLASIDSGVRVWFEKDGRRVSGKAAFSSDNTAIISFAPSYIVKAGETETLDLYVQLTDTLAGNDYQFSGTVTDASTLTDGSFVTPKLSTASYTVAPVVFGSGGTNLEYTDLSSAVELGKFTVQNADESSDTRDILFQNITLRQTGDADLANLSDIYLERDGEKVSTDATTDGKYVTFTVNDTVKDGTKATYYIKGEVSAVDNNSGDEYTFELKKDTDLNAVEVTNGFRSSVYVIYNSTTKTIASSVSLKTYTAKGSDIAFSRDDTLDLSTNVAPGSDDVVLMKGTIKALTPITLEDPTLNYSINSVASATGANNIFSTVYFKIGSTLMTWTPTSTDTQAKFSGTATLPAGDTTVEVYANLKDIASGLFKFDDMKLTTFATAEYVDNQNTVGTSVGTISGISISIDDTQLTATRTDGLGSTTVAAGSKGVLLNTLSLKVTQGNPVVISNPMYTITSSGAAGDNVFLTLYVDGTAVSTKTYKTTGTGGTVNFSSVSKTVTSSTPVELTIKADLSDAFSSGSLSVKLSDIDATDSLTSSDINISTVPSSAQFTIANPIGTLSASDSNPNAKLLLAGNTAEKLIAFRVKAQNDDVKLRDLVFSGASLDNISNYKVINSDGTEVATATSNNDTEVKFSNLTVTDVVTKDSTKTYYLVGDINTNTNATYAVDLLLSGSTIKGTNGNVVAMTGVDVSSNTHQIAENMVVVAKDTNSSKAIATSALRFSVTASGKDQATLSGVTLTINLSGYTGATQLAIYKDSISTNNLIGTGSAANGQKVISLTGLKTVDSGSTNHYLIAIENAVVDSYSNSQDWTVSVDDLEVNLGGSSTVSVKAYDNMGTLPITEVK